MSCIINREIREEGFDCGLKHRLQAYLAQDVDILEFFSYLSFDI